MPVVSNVFLTSPLGYSEFRNGSAVAVGTTAVDLDVDQQTGQALTVIFTIPPVAENSPDNLWDEIIFTYTWESVNTVVDGLDDGAKPRFWLLTENSVFGNLTTVTPAARPNHIEDEDATVSVQKGTATITYNNIAPGNYKLFVGEVNEGDSEKLQISVTNGEASELIPCFTRGSLIETVDGPVAIENLSTGDLVCTAAGAKPIRWIGGRKLSVKFLAAHPELRPIRIKAGALGQNTPDMDLIVSPQHRILLRSAIVQRMFRAQEVLVAAKQLLEIDGVSILEDLTEVEYFHLMLDQHEIIFSNGTETESLYAGKQALLAIGDTAREEIFTIFPELRSFNECVPPAAMLVPGRQARQLAKRHKKNGQSLVAMS